MALTDHLDQYCERLGPEFWAEPVNAISNAAFFVAAYCAWRMVRRQSENNRNARALLILPILLFVIGIGSFLFHTFATRWAEWADVLPILAFQLAAIALILRRLFDWVWWKIGLAWGFFFAASAGLPYLLRDVPTHGSSGYFAALLALLGFAALTRRQPAAFRPFALASLTFILSLTLRTLDLEWCEAVPLGTHWAWHGLNAVVLYAVCKGCAATERRA